MINKEILAHVHKQGFNDEDLYGAYKIFFGTLVSEPRLRIINFLRKGKKNVSEIMQELKMDQTSVSHNLSRLKICGFVNSETNKKYRYYSLNKKTINQIMRLIDIHMSKHCVHILHNMKKEV